MATHPFRLLNVFAEDLFGGNPLCVFEDGSQLDARSMQALAAQFNLSETTFLLPSTRADARVRVFTPSQEIRFGGHPALGSAQVLRALHGGDHWQLEFEAGVVALSAVAARWRFIAPVRAAAPTLVADFSDEAAAALFGLAPDDLLAAPVWCDTGSQQMLIAVRSLAALQRARPDLQRLGQWPRSALQRQSVYLFALDGALHEVVQARYFFVQGAGSIVEDPGTGSAAANLGSWLVSHGVRPPFGRAIVQGAELGRVCHLHLEVDLSGEISVGGAVYEVGRGYVEL